MVSGHSINPLKGNYIYLKRICLLNYQTGPEIYFEYTISIKVKDIRHNFRNP